MTTEDQINWIDDPYHFVSSDRFPVDNVFMNFSEDANSHQESTEPTTPDRAFEASYSKGIIELPSLSPQNEYGSSDESISNSSENLNLIINNLLDEQKKKKAKERRLRRMNILKTKRQNGTISFDGMKIRYESKRRR